MFSAVDGRRKSAPQLSRKVFQDCRFERASELSRSNGSDVASDVRSACFVFETGKFRTLKLDDSARLELIRMLVNLILNDSS